MKRLASLLAITTLSLPGLAYAASFTPLGDLPDGEPSSVAMAISADGSVVVGFSGSALGSEAFRWSDGDMVGLGDLGLGSDGLGVSDDGSVVVGAASSQAFRWVGGTMTGLGVLPGHFMSTAVDASADGSVVVGTSSGFSAQAFRWADGTMTGLGFLPNHTISRGEGVSANGEVVVGASGTGTSSQAFRWTNGVMSGLDDYPDGELSSGAIAVSPDGAFVVGVLEWGLQTEAFRWVEGEMLQLGYLDPASNANSYALDVSADGEVVVGRATVGQGERAFVWTPVSGMEPLIDVLAANGATGLEGWTLTSATGVSADGRWIAGYGTNPDGQFEAFLANISPVPAPPVFWLLGSAFAALAYTRR